MTLTDHTDDEQKSASMSSYSDVLARCLEDTEKGRATIEECVAHYPQFTELEQMLRAVAATRELPRTEMPLVDKAEIRQLALARLRANTAAKQVVSTRRRLPFISGWQRFAAIAAALIIIMSMSGIGLVKASEGALPTDALYVIKRVNEQITLSFASDQSRATVLSRIAQNRLDEMDALISRNSSLTDALIADTSSSIMAALILQTDTEQRAMLYDRTVKEFARAKISGVVSQDTVNSVMTIIASLPLNGSTHPASTPALTKTTPPQTNTVVATPSAGPNSVTLSATASRTPTSTTTNTASPTSTPTATASETATATASDTETDMPTSTMTDTPGPTVTSTDDPGNPDPTKHSGIGPTRRPTQKPNPGNGNGNGNGNGKGGGQGN